MVGDWNNQYFEADPILPVPLVHFFFSLITKDDDNKSLCMNLQQTLYSLHLFGCNSKEKSFNESFCLESFCELQNKSVS